VIIKYQAYDVTLQSKHVAI